MGRQVVWPDPEVRKLAKRLVAVMDDHGRLKKQKPSWEWTFFHDLVEDPQAHYHTGCGIPLADGPGGIRQGVYVATPDGALLASGNSNSPKKIAEILRAGLKAWDLLPAGKRRGTAEAVLAPPGPEPLEGALSLRTVYRDLPREGASEALQKNLSSRWNQDTIWVQPEEVLQLLPEVLEKGQRRQVPQELVQRWARFYLLDHVKAFTVPFQAREVERAELAVEVLEVTGDAVKLRYTGATRTAAEGTWKVLGAEDLDEIPGLQRRGFDAILMGEAVWDLKASRFRSFELVAVGTRWGGTAHNGRGSKKWFNDLDPAPMGVYLGLVDPKDPGARVRLWYPAPGEKSTPR